MCSTANLPKLQVLASSCRQICSQHTLEGLEHAHIICLLACCQKHETIRVLLQVAIILYLLMLMEQLCHALSLAKEALPKGN